jgi:hypothetical protein
MKKCLVIVLSVVFLLVCSIGAYATEIYPVWNMTGIVKDVEMEISEMWENGYTLIEFRDGRIIRFDGICAGLIFARGKDCKIEYQYSDIQGNHIIGAICEK